ncbi:hypothetical protein BD324DRAFT_36571 [Kockovaella imperatae]|uniref:Zn(2)-C6 fungal-type domain-containing protein n=1 Tax=Kockovaella imperatae TaxID=4999 RepID=A0A1Y1USS6_9TREE|nr:hypothetical protein BD324DRAFT_36571 [Kockovaella imperatae]ORX41073.1 hypothetical protein BD324DRAFT_36571 [Kockovaella imperatae]
MIDSTLSPRLSHLLIQEDSMTGRLLMPDGTDAREPMGGLSPPLTPSTSTFAFEASPLHKSARLPSPLEPNALFNSLRLPPPTALPYRRSQQSASLLSILSTSPPDSADSSFSFVRPASAGQRLAPPSSHSSRPMSSRAVPPSPPPTVFVARSASMRPSWSGPGQFGPSSFGSGLRPLTSAPLSSSFPNRPQGFVRRESVMSDIPPPTPYSRPNTSPYPMPSGAQRFHAGHGVEEGMGSRAPISRTTKACNACRTRKVRCDAGGLPGGQPGTCSRCRESGVDCVYSVIQKKRGPCPG